jgi:Tfp pilus assembly protein PilF
VRSAVAVALLAPVLLVTACAGRGVRPDALTAEERVDLGVAYYRRGDARRAAREFERATAARPGWPRAWMNLGDARLAAGEVAAAIQAYERALALAPEDPGAANNLAWALLQDAERWPEAEALVRQALARNPEPRGYYLDTLGVALLRKGDARGAIETLRAALADPGLEDPRARALVLEHAAEAYAEAGDAGAAAHCRGLAAEERAREAAGSVGRPPSLC